MMNDGCTCNGVSESRMVTQVDYFLCTPTDFINLNEAMNHIKTSSVNSRLMSCRIGQPYSVYVMFLPI